MRVQFENTKFDFTKTENVKDVNVEKHPRIPEGTQMVVDMNNGKQVSVIRIPNGYCDEETFEVATIEPNVNFQTMSPTTITDVAGYQTPEEVMKIVANV